MSSLARRYRSGGAGRPEPGELMPPDLRAIAQAPFDDRQRERLAAWLREAGWPRGRMGIVELEGYLAALLAWPVGVPTGAWLPSVWGGGGWRVPTKIAARSQFEEFVALIVGFLREIDQSLATPQSRFESSVLRGLGDRSRSAALQAWGKGFMTGLSLGSQGLKSRSESAGAAVRAIATHTAASAAASPQAMEKVVSAILALVAQRGSRGPLGALDAPPAVSPPVASETGTQHDENARQSRERSR